MDPVYLIDLLTPFYLPLMDALGAHSISGGRNGNKGYSTNFQEHFQANPLKKTQELRLKFAILA